MNKRKSFYNIHLGSAIHISNPASPEIIWGLRAPEEDHPLHHCCWTGRGGEREEDTYDLEKNPESLNTHALLPLKTKSYTIQSLLFSSQ